MAAKTNNLRKQIETVIKDVLNCPVFYRMADEAAVFPHCVWFLDNMSAGSDDFNRFIYSLSIDIYDRGYSAYNVEEWADALAAKFNFLNQAANGNFPTFYLQSSSNVTEDDKLIQHKHVVVQVLLY